MDITGSVAFVEVRGTALDLARLRHVLRERRPGPDVIGYLVAVLRRDGGWDEAASTPLEVLPPRVRPGDLGSRVYLIESRCGCEGVALGRRCTIARARPRPLALRDALTGHGFDVAPHPEHLAIVRAIREALATGDSASVTDLVLRAALVRRFLG